MRVEADRVQVLGASARADGAAAPGNVSADPTQPAPSVSDNAEVTVLIDAHDVLIRTLSLPLAAERDLRPLLRHELERVTPFVADDVRFDYEIADRDGQSGRIRVVLAIVLRDRLDSALARLSAAGIRPRRATTLDEFGRPLRVDWLGSAATFRLPFVCRSLRPAIAGGTLIAFLIALYAPLHRYRMLEEDMQAVSAEARSAALELRGKAADRAAAIERASFIDRARRAYISPLSIIADLSEALPDTAWVARLSLTGSSVQLQGDGIAASTLLEPISALTSLDGAEFQSPVSLNAGTRRESFSIAARIVRPDASP